MNQLQHHNVAVLTSRNTEWQYGSRRPQPGYGSYTLFMGYLASCPVFMFDGIETVIKPGMK